MPTKTITTEKKEKDLLSESQKLLTSHKYDEALKLNYSIIGQNPKNYEAYLNISICFFKMNKPEELLKIVKQIQQAYFKNLPISYIIDFANLLEKIDEFFLSLKFMQKAIEIEPENFDYLYSAGAICLKMNNFSKALEYFRKAENIDETYYLHRNIGMALLHLYRPKEAEEYLLKAMSLNNKDDRTYSSLASVYQALGKKEKVIVNLEKAIKLNKKNCYSYYLLSKAKKFNNNKEKELFINSMLPLLEEAQIKHDDKLFLCFALGKIYGELKDYDKSFFYYKIANNKKNESSDYNINNFKSSIERYRASFTKELLKEKRNYGSLSNLPIFIIGMPRSGTTLTEQIISCHSKVHGAGELNYLDVIAASIDDKTIKGHFSPTPFPENVSFMTKNEIRNIANKYLGKITSGIGNRQKVTNKMPANFQHIGFINILFPNAKIIHCRRHPMDIFLSIYFQHFKYLKYSSDPSLIVGYYKIYHSIMKHWNEQLPGKIYNSYYEELITNQEHKSKDLIKYCGLKWEEQCLSFHENKREIHTASHAQVRQKLYSDSMFKWKKYEKYIEAVKEALKDEIAEYEAELEQRVVKIN